MPVLPNIFPLSDSNVKLSFLLHFNQKLFNLFQCVSASARLSSFTDSKQLLLEPPDVFIGNITAVYSG